VHPGYLLLSFLLKNIFKVISTCPSTPSFLHSCPFMYRISLSDFRDTVDKFVFLTILHSSPIFFPIIRHSFFSFLLIIEQQVDFWPFDQFYDHFLIPYLGTMNSPAHHPDRSGIWIGLSAEDDIFRPILPFLPKLAFYIEFFCWRMACVWLSFP
jgi:hypothetical protein